MAILDNFTSKVEQSRKSGKTDTEILDFLSSKDASVGQKIKSSRSLYGQGKGVENDRDLVNFLSQKFGIGLPTTPSVPLKEEKTDTSSVKKEGSLLNKVGSEAGKFIKGYIQTGSPIVGLERTSVGQEVVKSLASPLKELIRPFATIAQKPIQTPLGEVKPLSAEPLLGLPEKTPSLGTGEAAFSALDLATSGLPVMKLFGKMTSVASKPLRGFLTGAGEVLTGVKKAKLNTWFDLAKNAPEKIENVKNIIKESPQEPFLGMARKVATAITNLKTKAQETFKVAKEAFKKQYPETTFDLSQKVPELKTALTEFGLTLKQSRNLIGKLTARFIVAPAGKITGFTDNEMRNIQGLVNDLKNAKDFSVDDLFALRDKFNNAFNAIKPNLDGSYRKYHALVLQLEDKANEFIDGVLPQTLKDANQLYKDYYQVNKGLGAKIVDASGEVKKGAESFLGNIMNLNKGAERQAVEEAGKKLGIDILDEADNLKTAKEVLETVPNTTKNRTMDVIRGILGSKITTGAAGAGIFLNPTIAVPALLINILSSPTVYRGIIEAIAGTASKLPVSEALKTLKPEEMILLQNLLKSLVPRKKE